jgi:anti-sigma B factor antagonist
MDISVDRLGDAARLRVHGDVDLSAADEFRRVGLDALTEPDCRQLVVEMSDVAFIDSTGVGVLVDLRNAALAREIPLVISDPSERVREVLRLTAMDAVFDVQPPRTAAGGRVDA